MLIDSFWCCLVTWGASFVAWCDRPIESQRRRRRCVLTLLGLQHVLLKVDAWCHFLYSLKWDRLVDAEVEKPAAILTIMIRRRAPSGLMPRLIRSGSVSVGKTVISISPSMNDCTWCCRPMPVSKVSMSLYFDSWLRWRAGVESRSEVVML